MRRICDSYSCSAIRKIDPTETMLHDILNVLGSGSTVKELGKVYRLKKSDLIRPFTLRSTLRTLAKTLIPDDDDCIYVDSNKVQHSVSKEFIAMLKAVIFYCYIAPDCIRDCLNSVLSDIDDRFRNTVNESSSTVVVNDSSVIYSNVNLLNEVRKEIFDLLEEVDSNVKFNCS